MNIVLVTEAYHPITNGVVHAIELQAHELVRQGHTVHIIAPTSTKPVSPYVHRVPSIALPGGIGYTVAFPFLGAAALIQAADIVHTHHPFVLGYWARMVARRHNKPFVFTNHTQYLKYLHYVPTVGRLLHEPLRSYVAGFANSCTVVLAPARGMARILEEHGVSRPIVIVPNGIDAGRYAGLDKQEARGRLGIAPHRCVVLFVGRLGKEKRVDGLLQAFARLPVSCDLVLAGEGPLRKELESLAGALAVTDRVRFLGPVPYERMPDVYAAADMFGIASDSEVHPLVVLEAQAAGLPVVAVPGPGASELVDHGRTGLIAGPDTASFADALRRLAVSSDLRRRFGATGAARAQAFGIERATRRLIDAYQAAAGRIGCHL